MEDKRYQVFISSTFEDLKEERRAVEETVIRAGDFPVQMEAFPAADEDQFDFIKSLIDKCDYYILVIAGRYGTQAEDGISYTEKEYHYAVSKSIPVLVMLYKNLGSLPAAKTEPTDAGKEKLTRFIEEAKTRLIKHWDSSEGLKLAVFEALNYAKETKPRIGWVRGDSIANIEALTELNQIRKENENLKATIEQFDIDIPFPDIPDPSDEITIPLVSNRTASYYGTEATISCSWIACFHIFFHSLSWKNHDWEGEYFYQIGGDDSRIKIGSALASEVSKSDCKRAFTITETTFNSLKSYYIEIGFMNSIGDEPFTEKAKRFARRQSIANMSASAKISLVDGEIKVHEIDGTPF